MRTALTLLFLPLAGVVAFGQGSERPTGVGNYSPFSLDLTAGLNLALKRSPLVSRISTGSTTPRAGFRAGVRGNIRIQRGTTLATLGIDYLRDRLMIDEYRKTSFSTQDSDVPLRERLGTLTVNESFLRIPVGLRHDWERISLRYGFALNFRLGGEQCYDFVQTTRGLEDRFGSILVIFDEPVVAPGSRVFPVQQTGYGSLWLAVGYRITEQITLLADADLGVFLPDIREYRHSHLRLGVTASYRLLGQ